MLTRRLISLNFHSSDFAAYRIDETAAKRDSKGCVLDDPAAFFSSPSSSLPPAVSLRIQEKKKPNTTVVKSTTAVMDSMYISVSVIHGDGQRATFHVICYAVVFLFF